MPASYANFYIANTTVVVPTYGSAHWDDEAVEKIGALFEGSPRGRLARPRRSSPAAARCTASPSPNPCPERQ